LALGLPVLRKRLHARALLQLQRAQQQRVHGAASCRGSRAQAGVFAGVVLNLLLVLTRAGRLQPAPTPRSRAWDV
jgi:hypothetical protein